MGSVVAFGVVVLCVGGLGLPIAAACFAQLPARGAGLATALGLLGLLWLAWLPPATGLVALGTFSTWAGLVVLAVAAALAFWRRRRRGAGRERERTERIVGRATFAVLVVAYVAWAILRSVSPGYGSGEQPMDHGFVAAILRSHELPPVDPWLAGQPLDNYYYGTHFLVATLTRLSGVDVSTAFNLAVAMFYALSAATVFGLTAELALLLRARLRTALVAAGAATLLAMLAGNPDGGLQLLLEPTRLVDYDWWAPSRVVDYAINEFPFFAFMYGEMHAHMLSIPTLLLVVAGAVQLALGGPGRGRRLVLGGAAFGLALGSLAFLDAWDQPTAIVLALGGALVWLVQARAGPLRRRLLTLLAFGAVVAITAVAAWLPFHLRFDGPGVGVRIVDPERDVLSVARDYGLVFGLVAWILAAFTVHALTAAHGWRRVALGAGGLAVVVAALGGAGLGGLAVFVLAVVPPLVAAIGPGRPLAERLAFLLAALAFALALIGEIVIVREAFSNGPFFRQNTVFKFGYHAWFLLAIAAAALAARPAASRLLMRWHWQAGLGALAGLCLVYPVAGTVARTHGFDQGPQLDLLAGLERTSSGDAAAVRWLRRHVSGTPTLVEATGDDYTPAARIASLTGIPSVSGWAGHELQWGKSLGFVRNPLVDELYTTLDRRRAQQLLRQFDVRFVIVGSLEQRKYAAAGLAKFAGLGTRVFDLDDTVIYDVRGAHPASVPALPRTEPG